MFKRITLVNSPYFLRGQSCFRYIEGYTIPLGILSLAAVIERDLPDVQIAVVDGMAENLSPKDLLLRILQTRPDLVGISSFTYNINDALLLSKWIKEKMPGVKIILGGVHVTQQPVETMQNPYVDFIIKGESEYSLRDLVAGKELSSIKGLAYRDQKGIIVCNPEKAIIENLDELPILAYHLINMKNYFPTAGQCHRFPTATMITSRGCPGNCIFCSSSLSGKVIRGRSAKNIFEEMTCLIDRYGIREIVFMDDVFTYDKNRVIELCRLIRENKLDLLWDCSTRIHFVDESTLKIMKEAGCGQLSFGVESGNEEILKKIKKGQKKEYVRETVRLAKKTGLETRCSFILGFPDDTMETMQDTIDFAIELDPHLVSFYVACPFPGTEMFSWAEKTGSLLTKNWSLYDQQHHIMKISNVPSEMIDKMYKRAYHSFYHRFRYILRRLLMIRSFYDIKNAFRAVRMTLNVHALPDIDYGQIETTVDNMYQDCTWREPLIN